MHSGGNKAAGCAPLYVLIARIMAACTLPLAGPIRAPGCRGRAPRATGQPQMAAVRAPAARQQPAWKRCLLSAALRASCWHNQPLCLQSYTPRQLLLCTSSYWYKVSASWRSFGRLTSSNHTPSGPQHDVLQPHRQEAGTARQHASPSHPSQPGMPRRACSSLVSPPNSGRPVSSSQATTPTCHMSLAVSATK